LFIVVLLVTGYCDLLQRFGSIGAPLYLGVMHGVGLQRRFLQMAR